MCNGDAARAECKECLIQAMSASSVASSSVLMIADTIDVLLRESRPVLIALTGPVAVGKSTYARLLSEELNRRHGDNAATVVSTDSFLHPNARLEAEGLIDRKGHPESFDYEGMQRFLAALRTDETIAGLQRYRHDTFDVEPRPDPLVVTPVMIIEGVNALQPVIADAVDLRLYLDADLSAILNWFESRFFELTALARSTGGGFYLQFAELSPGDLTATARWVYETINLPNLVQHIAPTKERADVVITKTLNHDSRARVTQRSHRTP